jgi:hypothetical protein
LFLSEWCTGVITLPSLWILLRILRLFLICALSFLTKVSIRSLTVSIYRRNRSHLFWVWKSFLLIQSFLECLTCFLSVLLMVLNLLYRFSLFFVFVVC